MKKLYLFFLLLTLSVFTAFGQEKTYHIKGKILNNAPYTHAYLFFSKGLPVLVEPIKDNAFDFKVTTEKEFLLASFFVSTEILDSAQIVLKSKDREQVKFLVVEDAELIITQNVYTATVNGTQYNAQLAEMFKVGDHSERLIFFTKYGDSPVAMIYLKSLIAAKKNPYITSLIDLPAYYALLSDRQKASPEGLELKGKIGG